MKCYQHPSSEVVASCNSCGRGLCHECSELYNIPLCKSCSQSIAKTEKTDITRSFIASIILVILALVITAGQPMGNKIMMSYIFAGTPWGWRVLTNITPSVFLFLPLFGWVIYFGVKLTISVWVGVLALPYFIFTRFKRWKELKSLENV